MKIATHPNRKFNGFALVVTLSLMILLTVLWRNFDKLPDENAKDDSAFRMQIQLAWVGWRGHTSIITL